MTVNGDGSRQGRSDACAFSMGVQYSMALGHGLGKWSSGDNSIKCISMCKTLGCVRCTTCVLYLPHTMMGMRTEMNLCPLVLQTWSWFCQGQNYQETANDSAFKRGNFELHGGCIWDSSPSHEPESQSWTDACSSLSVLSFWYLDNGRIREKTSQMHLTRAD